MTAPISFDLFTTFNKEQLALWASSIPEGEAWDSEGRLLTHQDWPGYACVKTWDSEGRMLTHQDSSGYAYVNTWDSKGNRLAYRNSDGGYEVKYAVVTKEEYEEFLNPKPAKELTVAELEKLLGYSIKIVK